MSFTDHESSEIDFQLRSLPVFSDLKASQQSKIKAATVLHELQPGESLLKHDQPTKAAIYVVLSGQVWLQYPGEAKVAMIAGCRFGHEMLKGAASSPDGVAACPFDATAKTNLRCAAFPWEVCRSVTPKSAASLLMLEESIDPLMRRKVAKKLIPEESEARKPKETKPAPLPRQRVVKQTSDSSNNGHPSSSSSSSEPSDDGERVNARVFAKKKGKAKAKQPNTTPTPQHAPTSPTDGAMTHPNDPIAKKPGASSSTLNAIAQSDNTPAGVSSSAAAVHVEKEKESITSSTSTVDNSSDRLSAETAKESVRDDPKATGDSPSSPRESTDENIGKKAATTTEALASSFDLDAITANDVRPATANKTRMELNRAVNKVRSRVTRMNSSKELSVDLDQKEKKSKSKKSPDDNDKAKRKQHKHRRNMSTPGDPKSDGDLQEGDKRARRHKHHSSRSSLEASKSDDVLQPPPKQSSKSRSSRKQHNESSRRASRKPKKGETNGTDDDSEGSLDLVAESGGVTNDNGSSGSIDSGTGGNSKSRFAQSKTFFEKARNSSQGLSLNPEDARDSNGNASKPPSHGSRGSFHDSKGSHSVAETLFQQRDHDGEDDESEGSLDIVSEEAVDTNKRSGSNHKTPLPKTSNHSSAASMHDSGLSEDSFNRFEESRHFFQNAERAKEETPTSTDPFGTSNVWKKSNPKTESEHFGNSSDASLDFLGTGQPSQEDPSENSLDLIGESQVPPEAEQNVNSSDQSIDMMGVKASSANELVNEASDQSLDLLCVSQGSQKSGTRLEDDLSKSSASGNNAKKSKSKSKKKEGKTKSKKKIKKCSQNVNQGTKSKNTTESRLQRSKQSLVSEETADVTKVEVARDDGFQKALPTKPFGRSIMKKSKAEDRPDKKRVRFCFEGRTKESDPDRLPRPPLNVRQVSLDISADFMPREYKKSQEEETQITQALSNVFAFESMSTNNLKTLINAFEPQETEAGAEIVGPDSEECDFYVVADGEVSVVRDGEEIDIFGSGETFGEENLFHRPSRRVSVSARTKTQLFKVDQATYRSVLQVETRTLEKRKRELTARMPLFDCFAVETRQKIASLMKPAVFSKGATISTGEGKQRRLYVIDKGTACSAKESEHVFGTGDFFGEKGFRTGDGDVEEAVAQTNVAAYYIDVSTYEKAIGPLNERVMPDIQSPRFKEMRPIVLSIDGMRFSKKKPLTIEETRAVISLMDDTTFEKGEMILKSGEEIPGCMFYLKRGTAECKYATNSVSFIIPGTLFGGSHFKAALASKNRTAVSQEMVVATDRCVVSILRIDDFLATKKKYLEKLNHVAYKGGDSDSDASESESSGSDFSYGGDFGKKCHTYRVENLVKKTILGEGGFGQVWMVFDNTEPEPKPYAFKIQSKYDLVHAGHAESAVQEKSIMASLNHPFVVKLLASFQDEKFVYFLLNMIQGGELYTIMHPIDEDLSSNGMPEEQAKFYAFGIADALAYIHSKNIVYRDLKPENVLIDDRGYPVLVDMGLAKVLKDGEKTFTLVGTPGYLAPEVCLNIGHNYSADHWALGVLIYEMIAGEGPFFFFGVDQVELYRSIVQDPHETPENASPDAVAIVDFLLTKDPNGRLGSLSGGEVEIMKDDWFKGMNATLMRKGKVTPPWKPDIDHAFDTSNFEDWSELEDRTRDSSPEISPNEALIFETF